MPLTHCTILLVEDESLVRTVVSDVLKDTGYAVIEAVDGQAGYEVLISGAQIDLLISDIRMPGRMDGHELARAALSIRPTLPMLLMTGCENEELAEAVWSMGVRIVHKPFTFNQLLALAQCMLEAPKSA